MKPQLMGIFIYKKSYRFLSTYPRWIWESRKTFIAISGKEPTGISIDWTKSPGGVLARGLFPNPRQVKRALNVLIYCARLSGSKFEDGFQEGCHFLAAVG